METITSRTNSLITRIRKLTADRKFRRQQRLMVCEGPKMLAEAIRWQARLETVLWQEGVQPTQELPDGVRQAAVPADLLRSVAPTQTPQQVLFLCALPDHGLPEDLSGTRYLVLDGLQDPGNVGTLWRTADAFGADGLVLLPGCADPWNPKTLRATMGAVFRCPVWTVGAEELSALLKKSGIPLYGAALREDTLDARAVDYNRCAIAIGSEGRGLTEGVLALCDRTIKIPMSEHCESLNAAAAATVLLWEAARND